MHFWHDRPLLPFGFQCLLQTVEVVDVHLGTGLAAGRLSDSDYSDFATGSPDEPFQVARVACENHGFPAKSRRHHNGINRIRRSGQAKQAPCFVRVALTERNHRATSQETPELGLL